jgi:hypothetical protein
MRRLLHETKQLEQCAVKNLKGGVMWRSSSDADGQSIAYERAENCHDKQTADFSNGGLGRSKARAVVGSEDQD